MAQADREKSSPSPSPVAGDERRHQGPSASEGQRSATPTREAISFKPVTTEEIPKPWRRIGLESIRHHAQALGIPTDQVEVQVGIEMPQIPCCMAWMHWYTEIKEPMLTDVPVMISSREQWVTPERRLAVKQIAATIATLGRPIPVWRTIATRREKDPPRKKWIQANR